MAASMGPLVMMLLLTAAPRSSDDVQRFVHLLEGAPVGEVELSHRDGHYVYVSRQFFRRGKTSERRFEAPPSKIRWASESLLTQHRPGCWPVEDELTHEQGENCVTKGGSTAGGTTLGQRFTAWYSAGRLEQLDVGSSRFLRTDDPIEFRDPFGDGYPLTGDGKALGVSPELAGTRIAHPTPSGTAEDCVAAARAYVAQEGPAWEVVYGIVEDSGRGFPHAWVRNRVNGEERDPSRPTRSLYLALPSDRAAGVYLDLLGKRRALVRVAAQ